MDNGKMSHKHDRVCQFDFGSLSKEQYFLLWIYNLNTENWSKISRQVKYTRNKTHKKHAIKQQTKKEIEKKGKHSQQKTKQKQNICKNTFSPNLT